MTYFRSSANRRTLATATPTPSRQRPLATASHIPKPTTAIAASSRHASVATSAAPLHQYRSASNASAAAISSGIAKACGWMSRMLIPWSDGLTSRSSARPPATGVAPRRRREDHHQILGARERDTADGPAAGREHGDQNRGHHAGHQLEWPGQSRQGRRVYLARRLSKRRERRRPRLFKTNQKSTARIRRP